MTQDMNEFDIDRRFDRVVSVEMFEHMRNWPRLFGKVAAWLKPEGRFFMHVFCHKTLALYIRGSGRHRLDESLFFLRRDDALL